MAGNGHVYVREGHKAKAAWAYGGTPLANLTSARVRAKAKAGLASCLSLGESLWKASTLRVVCPA